MRGLGDIRKASSGGAIVFIFVSVALDVMAGTMAFPVLPKLIATVSAGSAAHVAELFGALATLFAAMQFLASPVLGALSDTFGRRPVIIASCFGLGIDSVIMALAPNVAWLFAGRFLAGALAASMTAASAYLADVSPSANRAKLFGYLFAAMGLGQSIGPAFGGWLATFGVRTPFWAAAALFLLNGLYGVFVLPESLARDRRSAFSTRHFNPLETVLALKRSYPRLVAWAVVIVVFALGAAGVNVLFVLYTGFRYDWTPRDIGLLLTAFGFGIIAVQMTVVPFILRKLGDYGTMLSGYAFQIGGIVLCGLAATASAFSIGISMLLFGIVASPAQSAIISRIVGETDQGKLAGATRSLYNLSAILAPALFTTIFARAIVWGGKPLSGLPFLIAAALMACAAVAAARLAPSGTSERKAQKTPN